MQRPVAAHRGHMSPAGDRASKALPRHTRCRDTAAAHADRRRRGAIPSTAPRRAPAGGTASHTNLSRLATAGAVQSPPRGGVPSVGHFTTHVLGKSENENRDVPGHVSVSTAGGWRRRRLWFGDAYEFSLVEHTRREPVSRARTWYAPRAKTRKRHSAAAAAVPGPLQIRDFPG